MISKDEFQSGKGLWQWLSCLLKKCQKKENNQQLSLLNWFWYNYRTGTLVLGTVKRVSFKELSLTWERKEAIKTLLSSVNGWLVFPSVTAKKDKPWTINLYFNFL